ncbi:class VII chitin synthase [Apiospora phragmitis]|uniref:chitin synthase n=1 Tax=Apiospora phragmitis TaxID=2905665 RepID=A0ABR1X6K4_9PEZI
MEYDITKMWPVQDIVYTCIVGVVMLAALLEWFLWIAAFLYCLVKVFQKAEHWTIRVLAVIVGIFFTLFRFIFLPIMVVTLPLPSVIVQYYPENMVSILQWFAFWSFAGLLTVPWLFCIYQLVTHQLGRTKRMKQVLDEVSAPKCVIVMPCYKEDPDILVTAINSVVDCDYPPSCIHVFLSFDGDQEDELYLNTIERLGVPLTLESYPKSIDVTYRAARITVSRFPHGGKRHCQKMTFKLIDKVYQDYLKRNDNLFILFIDSDCILDRVCLQNFVYDMELSPGNRRDMLAMTGVITSTTKSHSLITLLQDMEYVHGQLFERTVESGCGAVTCLPGALTMLRFSAFRRMAKYYFADKAEQCEDLFDFAKSHLGEDRWLTHLFMIGAKKRYQIQMCTSAFCKTEAVQTYKSLIKQRRRWFLGFITNEVCMLTDWRLWRRYPILVLVRFMQNTIRTTALLFFIMVLAIITTTKKVNDLPVGFIGISLGLNWLLMVYFGLKLKRFKIWLYPLMFIVNPFFNWYYMVYGIFTAGQRTWGGPRADAATADADTTPQQAVEQAEKQGDELNIVPETFIPATEGITTSGAAGGGEASGSGVKRSRSKVMPPQRAAGKFTAPEKKADGFYVHPEESRFSVGNLLEDGNGAGPSSSSGGARRYDLPHRDSWDSFMTGGFGGNGNGSGGGGSGSGSHGGISSVYMPRRVESIMGEEDRRKYELAQQSQYNQWVAKSKQFAVPQQGQVYQFSEAELVRGGWTDTVDTAYSDYPTSSEQHNNNNNNNHKRHGSSDDDDRSAASSRNASPARPAVAASAASEQHQQQQQQQQQQRHGRSSRASSGNQQQQPQQQQSLSPHHHARGNSGHQQQTARTGRSPLGRASWVRTSGADEDMEMEESARTEEEDVT